MQTEFRAGGLKAPQNADTLPSLKAPKIEGNIRPLPLYHDKRYALLPNEDQGQTSYCAIYSLCACIEYEYWKAGIGWNQIPPESIAAEIDRATGGNVRNDGASFPDVHNACQRLNLIPASVPGKILRTDTDCQYAAHRYGVVAVGMNTSRQWNEVDEAGWIPAGGTPGTLGPHGVCLCWWDCRDPAGAHMNQPAIGIGNSWMPWGWNGFGRMTLAQFRRELLYGWAICWPRLEKEQLSRRD